MNHSRTPDNDLISRSALIKMLRFKRRAVYGSGSMDDIARVIEDVEKFPAVKVGKAEPVRHGRWIERYPKDIWDCYKCSCCDYMDDREYDFCPNCGCKMDAEVER